MTRLTIWSFMAFWIKTAPVYFAGWCMATDHWIVSIVLIAISPFFDHFAEELEKDRNAA